MATPTQFTCIINKCEVQIIDRTGFITEENLERETKDFRKWLSPEMGYGDLSNGRDIKIAAYVYDYDSEGQRCLFIGWKYVDDMAAEMTEERAFDFTKRVSQVVFV